MKKFKSTICGAILAGAFLAGAPAIAGEAPEAPKQEATVELTSTIHELETLFVLMQERLALMHELARYKWNHDQSSETLKGELFSESNQNLASFTAAQNAAALEVQKQDFARFAKEEVAQFEKVKDYKSELLPELEKLNEQILSCAASLINQTQQEALPEFLKDVSFHSFKQEGIQRDIYDIATAPLFQD